MYIQHLTEDSYVTLLLKPVVQTPGDLAQLQAGDSVAWMKESYSIAVKNAYNLPPPDSNSHYILQPAYYDSNHDIVNHQLLAGGVRLAAFLNKTFTP